MLSKRRKREAAISLGAQVGGSAAYEATNEHVLDLRKLLATHCVGPYSPEVDELAPILRVDGDVAHWGFEGCERLRRSLKDRYLTLDIGVPITKWRGVPEKEIRAYLLHSVSEALEMFIARLRKDNVIIHEARLRADFAKVRSTYLKD